MMENETRDLAGKSPDQADPTRIHDHQQGPRGFISNDMSEVSRSATAPAKSRSAKEEACVGLQQTACVFF